MIEHARIPFADLVFLDDNPRTRTPEGLQRMAADIQADPTFFENRPVLVNLTGGIHQVYAGDLRAHAAHDVLGWEDIPCNIETDLPPDLMRQRAIKDNLHRETWAPDILTSSWATDHLAAWGLTPDTWGGEQPDTPAAGYTASEDDYELPPEIVTDIVPGDLFEIGPHRLLCGDSTSADDVAKVMGGEVADMVFTDPPYGVDYSGGIQFTDEGVKKEQRSRLKNDHSERIYEDFLPLVPSITSGPVYTWFAGTKAETIYRVISDIGEIHALLIWVKNGGYGALNACYKQKHEPCLFWKPKGGKLNFVGDTTECTIWEIKKDGINEFHPTQKPVALAARAIGNHSGSLVCDPFLGSGTTMVAAHQLNRRCYGLEIDPKYCQVIIDRMHKLDPTLTITRNGKPYTPA